MLEYPQYSRLSAALSVHSSEFTDLTGQRLEVDFEGFIARVFQHEYDHLNGLVYLDRVISNQDIISEAMFLKIITT